MNAAHPNATPAEASDPRVAEPSMEEILASIRRIIADDQSFPGNAPSLRDVSGLRPALPEAQEPEPPAPVHVLRPATVAAPAPEPVPVPVSTAVPPRPEMPTTGDAAIAAPQFPSPHGPYAESVPAPAPEAAAPDPIAAQQPVAPAEPVAARPSFGAPVPEREPAVEPLWEAAQRAPAAPSRQAAEPTPDLYEAPLGYEPPATSRTDRRADLFSAATDQSVVSAFNVLAASRLADNSDQLLALTGEMIRPMLREWLDEHLPSMVERLVRAEIERVSRSGR